MMIEFDMEVDFLVVGVGVGGMMVVLVGVIWGMLVLVCEKIVMVGGMIVILGGMIWILGNCNSY